MKKVIFIAVLFVSIFSFSSFSSSKQLVARAHKAGAVPFRNEGSFTYDTYFFLCNGDIVFMTLTDNYENHGVTNNNRFMIDGTDHYTGTGFSIITGELYTLNTTFTKHDNVPITGGAAVIRGTFKERIYGASGSVQEQTATNRQTFNAKGELTANNTSYTSDCQ